MDERIYLIMDYCSGGDLSFYIKKRGRLPTLEYVALGGSSKQYWPHPEEGGLDEVVVKNLLGQLGTFLLGDSGGEELLWIDPSCVCLFVGCSLGSQVSEISKLDSSRHQASGDSFLFTHSIYSRGIGD